MTEVTLLRGEHSSMETIREPVLALFRMVIGLLFAFHGASSLFGVFGGARGTGGSIPIGEWPGWWAAAIQLTGGLLVLFGLGTRWAAVACSGSMAYAYFVVHQPLALLPLRNGGELAAMFCWAFLVIAVFGPGSWSLDTTLKASHTRRTKPALDSS